jgi:uncharacterized cupredoxin-like copper-binding protein
MGLARNVLVAAAHVTAAAGCRVEGATRPITRQITIHYTHFDPTAITVPHGVPVTFVIVNQDPIEHEWLLGDAAFHERHRRGTEAHHGARPNEISIPPLSTVETTLTFDQPGTLAYPGTLLYICHLPGHEAYGMVGTLTIT